MTEKRSAEGELMWGTPDQRAAAFTSVGVGGALIAGVLIGRYVRDGK